MGPALLRLLATAASQRTLSKLTVTKKENRFRESRIVRVHFRAHPGSCSA